MSKHSTVVLCSEHWGNAVLVKRSYADLQSDTEAEVFSRGNSFPGWAQSHSGSRIQDYSRRIHINLSTVLLRAAASAPKVLRTTLGTFLLAIAQASWCYNSLLILQQLWGRGKDKCSLMGPTLFTQ